MIFIIFQGFSNSTRNEDSGPEFRPWLFVKYNDSHYVICTNWLFSDDKWKLCFTKLRHGLLMCMIYTLPLKCSACLMTLMGTFFTNTESLQLENTCFILHTGRWRILPFVNLYRSVLQIHMLTISVASIEILVICTTAISSFSYT